MNKTTKFMVVRTSTDGSEVYMVEVEGYKAELGMKASEILREFGITTSTILTAIIPL